MMKKRAIPGPIGERVAQLQPARIATGRCSWNRGVLKGGSPACQGVRGIPLFNRVGGMRGVAGAMRVQRHPGLGFEMRPLASGPPGANFLT